MYSDRGGQLVAANEDLQTMVNTFDHNVLQRYGATNGMTWRYILLLEARGRTAYRRP